MLPSAVSLSTLPHWEYVYQDQKEFLRTHLATPRSTHLKWTSSPIRPKLRRFQRNDWSRKVFFTFAAHNSQHLWALNSKKYNKKQASRLFQNLAKFARSRSRSMLKIGVQENSHFEALSILFLGSFSLFLISIFERLF